MGLWKFLKGIFGAKETVDCGCDTPESCPTPEVCEVEVPVVKAVETKKEVVVEVPVQAEETKVTAKEIKAKEKDLLKKLKKLKKRLQLKLLRRKLNHVEEESQRLNQKTGIKHNKKNHSIEWFFYLESWFI